MNYWDRLAQRMETKAVASYWAKRNGKCTHGWRRGQSGPNMPGLNCFATCLHCGKTATEAELDRDAERIFKEYLKSV